MRATRDESGTTAVEFAIVAPAVLALLFGVIEAGRLMFEMNAIESGLFAAARVQMLNSAASETQIRTAFCSRVPADKCNVAEFVIVQETVSGRVWRNVTVTIPFNSPVSQLLPLPARLTASRKTPVF